jgi:hypothetical protein
MAERFADKAAEKLLQDLVRYCYFVKCTQNQSGVSLEALYRLLN